MSIFKSSNFSPELEEINVEESNVFSAQINTSGESAKAYKLSLYNNDGTTLLKKFSANKTVANKSMLQVKLDPLDISDVLENGKDYQWGLRTYNLPLSSHDLPNTVVCNGYIVGSTKNTVWMRLQYQEDTNKTLADQIVEDRYIEFKITDSNSIIKGAHDGDDYVKPTPNQLPISSSNPYVERKKIDWVTKNCGTNKDIIKIETTYPLEYNFINGTPFSIYKCSSDHTVTSAFADPNTNINVANYIVIYNNVSDAYTAFTAGDNPGGSSTSVTPAQNSRKIIGYSSDTGEIRVNDAWTSAPKNGQAYRTFSYDSSLGTYTEVFSSDITYKVNSEKSYYSQIGLQDSSYYTDRNLTQYKDTLSQDTVCKFAGVITKSGSNIAIGTFTMNSITYYVALNQAGTTSSTLTVNNVNGYGGTIIKDNTSYYVNYSDLNPYIGTTATSNIFNAQIIGGTPITNSAFTVLSNVWNSINGTYRIFIQPNTNIKLDETNPDVLILTQSGAQIIINTVETLNSATGKKTETTFNKLDDSQWLLEQGAITLRNSGITFTESSGAIAPQTDYTVYSSFADATPLNIFYARQTPTLSLQCRNYEGIEITKYAPKGKMYNLYYVPVGTKYYSDYTCETEVGTITDDDVVANITNAQYSPVFAGIKLNGVEYYVKFQYMGPNEDIAGSVGALSYDIPLSKYRRYKVQGTLYESGVIELYVDGEIKEYSIYADDIQDFEYVNIVPYSKNGSVVTQLYYIYPYKNIEFHTELTNNTVPVKYYQYYLYDDNGDLVANSEQLYNNSLAWGFRGLQTSSLLSIPKLYTIKVVVTDEYNKVFTQSTSFGVYYPTIHDGLSLVEGMNCHEYAAKITGVTPLQVLNTASGDSEFSGLTPITDENIEVLSNDVYYAEIPAGKLVNYTTLENLGTNINIPDAYNLVTKLQLTDTFVEGVTTSTRQIICKIGNTYTEDDNTTEINDSYGLYLEKDSSGYYLRCYKNTDYITAIYCFNDGASYMYRFDEEVTSTIFNNMWIYISLKVDSLENWVRCNIKLQVGNNEGGETY